MATAVISRPKLWTPDDLAEYLGVSVGWIYKRTRQRGPDAIPHLKLGKYLRFDPESRAFNDWLARCAASGTGDEGLTLSFPAGTLRPEKKGQTLTKGENA